ncbi:unnamed protein product [Brassica oleracea var. botrytis]
MWSSEKLLKMGMLSLLTSSQVESLVQDAVSKGGDFQTCSSPYSVKNQVGRITDEMYVCGVKQTGLGREGSKYGMDEYL